MELDELKDIWKRSGTEFRPRGEAEIARMLRGNSVSVVEKLKRSVWFELAITLVAGVGLLLYAFQLPGGALKWITVSILFLFVAYSVYYVKKLVLLRRFDAGDTNLRESLGKLVLNLNNYLNFYKRSYTILYPVYFCLGMLFAALEAGSENFIRNITTPKTALILAGVGLSFFFITKLFTAWYLKKLYGNYLDMLQSLLSELNSMDRPEAV